MIILSAKDSLLKLYCCKCISLFILHSHTVKYIYDQARMQIGRSGIYYRHTITMWGPSDGKEVKDVFRRPVAPVEVGSAR